MAVNAEFYKKIDAALKEKNVTLVAVSKTKPVEEILELYHLGQRDFGENYVQELLDKQQQLPADIHWHFIGHLQTNKVKLIAPFITLIHSVDSLRLLKEIDKEAKKNHRVINCLLQVHIAKEETKFGLDVEELEEVLKRVPGFSDPNAPAESPLVNASIKGLMGMASFTDNIEIIKKEFQFLKGLFDKYPSFSILSMGMSADYEIAIEEGSNMVRIGSLLFGKR